MKCLTMTRSSQFPSEERYSSLAIQLLLPPLHGSLTPNHKVAIGLYNHERQSRIPYFRLCFVAIFHSRFYTLFYPIGCTTIRPALPGLPRHRLSERDPEHPVDPKLPRRSLSYIYLASDMFNQFPSFTSVRECGDDRDRQKPLISRRIFVR